MVGNNIIRIIEVSKKSTKFELCLCYAKQEQYPITDADFSYEKSSPLLLPPKKGIYKKLFVFKDICQEIQIIMRSTAIKKVQSKIILEVILSPTKDSY